MSLPVVYHPDYVTPLPDGHRFPMPKFRLLHDLLLKDGVTEARSIYTPEIADRSLLEKVHTVEYARGFIEGTLDAKAFRRIGLPWSEGLVKRTLTAVGGSLLTAKLALKYGIACNTAGGTHHAFPDYGSGFCIFNDLAIVCRILQGEGLVRKVLIIDLDVHQGDGTARIFQEDGTVFTFSMHCEANFPGTKQKSDLDVPLPVGLDDDGYLRVLRGYLDDLLSTVAPDLVLYDAGVDPHKDDRLGKLCLTNSGLYRRELMVLRSCLKAGYPVAGVIGGGYANDMESLVYRHSLLHRAAREVYYRY